MRDCLIGLLLFVSIIFKWYRISQVICLTTAHAQRRSCSHCGTLLCEEESSASIGSAAWKIGSQGVLAHIIKSISCLECWFWHFSSLKCLLLTLALTNCALFLWRNFQKSFSLFLSSFYPLNFSRLYFFTFYFLSRVPRDFLSRLYGWFPAMFTLQFGAIFAP